MKQIHTHAVQVTLRVLAAVAGGYALTAAVVALSAAVLTLSGVNRAEAVVASSMSGFVFYLVVLLWAFSVKGVGRLWFILLGATVVVRGLLWMVG